MEHRHLFGSSYRYSPLGIRYTNIGIYMAVFIALIDQISKWWLLHFVMMPPQTIKVTPFFNLALNWNYGITFGLFNHEQEWLPYIFIGVAIVIVLLLLNWLMKTSSLLVALGLGLVMGGAVGNVVDRFNYGAVVDFLDFHAFGHHWPAFNVADSAIVCGVGLLLLENLVTSPKKG